MPAGFQAFAPNGELRTEVTDRLTRVVAEGTLSLPSLGQSQWVPVSGMLDDGNWFVITVGQNPVIPGNGGFTVYRNPDWFGEFRYTVFRI